MPASPALTQGPRHLFTIHYSLSAAHFISRLLDSTGSTLYHGVAMTPSPQVYLNGQFLPRAQANFDLEDRGTMFGDGVYEVVRYYFGQPLALHAHLDRLRRSLTAIELPAPAEVEHLGEITRQLIERNATPEASVYWQITRGPAPRKHALPAAPRPTVLVLAYPLAALDPAAPAPRLKAILAADERWHRCCIKTLMLLPNVLAKNRALCAGADEAILHRAGIITEGSATNVFAVREGVLWTRPADQWILAGITRQLVLTLAGQLGLTVRQEAFSVEQLAAADEIFITGSTTQIASIVNMDGRAVGAGATGPITAKLHRAFTDYVQRECSRR